MPPIPTEPVSPKPIPRPCLLVSLVSSSAVRPGLAQTVRSLTSSSIAFICDRSSTIPPSVVLWPALL